MLAGCKSLEPEPRHDPALEAFCGNDHASVEAAIDGLILHLTLEEKVALMAGGEGPVDGLWGVPGIERIGLEALWMVDGPRGVHRATGPATAFPVGMARAATWDCELEERVGEAIGLEARAAGAGVILAPTINILRHPMWGRAQETDGDDPCTWG